MVAGKDDNTTGKAPRELGVTSKTTKVFTGPLHPPEDERGKAVVGFLDLSLGETPYNHKS